MGIQIICKPLNPPAPFRCLQNLADCFRTPLDSIPADLEGGLDEVLDTFLVYNLRRRTTSSAKRKANPGATHIHQTPDGSFYDLQRNARDVLTMSGEAIALRAAPLPAAMHHADRSPVDARVHCRHGGR